MSEQYTFQTNKMSFKPVETPNNPVDYRDVDTYTFLHDAYTGDGGFLGKDYSYLVADRTENFYNTRNKMSHYINDMARYITAQYQRVFTDIPPQYKTNNTLLVDMLNDIDRRGSYVDDMKQYALANCLLDGVVFLASGNDGEQGKTPWVSVYSAMQYNDEYSTKDNFGNVIVYVFAVGGDKYHVYTDDKFYVMQADDNTKSLDDMSIVDDTDMPANVVRPVYSIPSYGRGVLPTPHNTLSIARMSLNLYELHSRMVQVMTRQLFDRLVISGDIDSAPDGVTNALVLGSETANAQLLSPDPNVTKIWSDVIGQYTQIMYEHMRDGGVIIQKSSQIPESGASKAYTFQPVDAALNKSIKICEKIDAYVVDSFNLWMGANAQLEVVYNHEYAPMAPISTQDLRDLVEVGKELEVDGILQEVAKNVLTYLNIDSTSDTYKSILTEIDGIRTGLTE